MKKIILLSLALMSLAVLAVSCDDGTTLRITNKIGGVALEELYIGDEFIRSAQLLPGESVTVDFLKYKLPLTGQISFYMTSGSNKIYLRTKQSYTIRYTDHIIVDIENDTEVESVMTETKCDTHGAEVKNYIPALTKE